MYQSRPPNSYRAYSTAAQIPKASGRQPITSTHGRGTTSPESRDQLGFCNTVTIKNPCKSQIYH